MVREGTEITSLYGLSAGAVWNSYTTCCRDDQHAESVLNMPCRESLPVQDIPDHEKQRSAGVTIAELNLGARLTPTSRSSHILGCDRLLPKAIGSNSLLLCNVVGSFENSVQCFAPSRPAFHFHSGCFNSSSKELRLERMRVGLRFLTNASTVSHGAAFMIIGADCPWPHLCFFSK